MNSNNNKICLNIFLKGFGVLSLFLLSLGFIGITSASASPVFTHLAVTSGYVTIPEADGTLLCYSTGTMTNDSVAMTEVLNYGGFAYNFYMGQYGYFSYTPNPTVGDRHIVSSSGYFQCYFATGLDNSNLIANTEVHVSSNGTDISGGVSYPNAVADNVVFSLISTQGNTQITSSNSSPLDYISYFVGSFGANISFNWAYKVADGSLTTFNYTNGQLGFAYGYAPNYAFIELNVAPAPANNNYVYITRFNSDPIINIVGSPVYFNDIYDICDTFDENNEYVMVYEVDGLEISRQQLSSSVCSTFMTGSIYNAVSVGEGIGVSSLKIYSMPYVLNQPIMDESLANLTLEASSQAFISQVSEPLSGFIWLKPRYSINAIDQTATTTNIYYTYSFTRSDYADSITKICLDDFNSCTVVTNDESGPNFINIDNDLVTGTMITHLTFQNASSTVLYTSEDFTIYKNSVLPESTVLSLFGKSADEMACSADEWAEAESSMSWFNFTKLKCNTFVSGISFVNTFYNAIVWIFQSLGNKIILLFPLDIPTKILESWNASQTTVLDTDLQFLDATESDKTINGYMPHQWMGTSEDYTPQIFGAETMSQGSTHVTDLFAKFKQFTIFFQYALLVLGLIVWGKSVYKDMSNNVHKDN